MDQTTAALEWFVDNLTTIVSYTGRSLLLMIVVLWIFVTLWVWTDSGERTQNKFFRIIVTLFVVPFNIPGLLIYMMIRPPLTIDEMYWAELERRYLMYQTIDLDDCPKCGEGLMPGFNNCPACGLEIKTECSGCGVSVHKDYKFCPFCGTQNRQRAIAKQEMTQTKMEQEIKEQRDDVAESIEKQTVRYARRFGLVDKVGTWAISKYEDISKTLKNRNTARLEMREAKKNSNKTKTKKTAKKVTKKKTSKKNSKKSAKKKKSKSKSRKK